MAVGQAHSATGWDSLEKYLDIWEGLELVVSFFLSARFPKFGQDALLLSVGCTAAFDINVNS